VIQKHSNILIKSIGQVKNNINWLQQESWRDVVSELILEANLEAATEGLEQFSHIIVIFWMHRISTDREVTFKVHPRNRQDLPLVGLLATRAPIRPNPIGVSVVELLECRGNTLKVKGLDAINGTPILDIKPYLPRDGISNATFPSWVTRL
jgi:tRNA-Thr(GGU) m(6)t(6)A37 methyltransferase TsaA